VLYVRASAKLLKDYREHDADRGAKRLPTPSTRDQKRAEAAKRHTMIDDLRCRHAAELLDCERRRH
jgi:hypothetical protein